MACSRVTKLLWPRPAELTSPSAHYERAKAAGAEIIDEYAEKDYGGAGYSCRDPEGHLWWFGGYDPRKA